MPGLRLAAQHGTQAGLASRIHDQPPPSRCVQVTVLSGSESLSHDGTQREPPGRSTQT